MLECTTYDGYTMYSNLHACMLPQDPTLQELQVAGAQLHLQDQPHLLLDGCFYVSGFIPRTTSYEQGNPGHATQMVRPAAATEQGGAACNATFTAHMLCLYSTQHSPRNNGNHLSVTGPSRAHPPLPCPHAPPLLGWPPLPPPMPLAGQLTAHGLVML